MTSQFTKRQHYIPQFYLKGFSQDNSHLYLFDKQGKFDQQFRYQTTENIAFENNFYTHETVDHTKENFEDLFSQIESIAAEIIRKIVRGEDILPQNRADFAFFLSMLWVRTPSFKKESLEMQGEMAEKIMRKQLSTTPKSIIQRFYKEVYKKEPTEAEILDIIDFAKNSKRSRMEIDFPQEYWLKQMLHMSVSLCRLFQSMNWDFVQAEKTFSFITSDNPTLLIPPLKWNSKMGFGLITPGVKKIIPINSQICLIMYDQGERWRTTYKKTKGKDFIRFVNYNIARNAERFIFSPFLSKIEVILKKDKKSKISKNSDIWRNN